MAKKQLFDKSATSDYTHDPLTLCHIGSDKSENVLLSNFGWIQYPVIIFYCIGFRTFDGAESCTTSV
jgi:hypothetical protein